MALEIQLKNTQTGTLDTAYLGFSWTTLFFGAFPALFRADFGTFIGFFIIGLMFSLMSLGLGWFACSIIWAFFYNSYHLKKRLKDGYKIMSGGEAVRIALTKVGIDSNIAMFQNEK